MGFWKSERGINGDGWADEMGRCMKALEREVVKGNSKTYGDNCNHEITMQEFADLVEFCSRGHLIVDVRYPEADGERPLSELHSDAVETYPNRGQIHCPTECAV
ncbi:hypothetical protein LCGC14_2197570 [marine sediment metagenome]|uniref:Uncharacterized protein n=1 Tax=marine sediment metagenome TaxID=412755 RepID=A0A0F9E4T4_9ZZZZ